MKTILTIFQKTVLLLLFALPLTAGAQITMTVKVFPYINNEVHLTAVVTSTYAVKSVTADLAGRTVELLYDQYNKDYRNSLSPVGLPQGPLPLTVVAEDILGNRQTDTQVFIHNTPPNVVLEAPVNNSGWGAKVKVKAQVNDPGSANCKGTVTGWWGTTEFVNAIDTFFSAPAEPGATKSLISVYAIDSSGLQTGTGSYVYVDNSPHLKPQFAVPGIIMGFRDTRLLTVDTDEAYTKKKYYVTDMRDSSVKRIPIDSTKLKEMGIVRGILCEGGAAFIINYNIDAWDDYFHFYIYRNGRLFNISEPLHLRASGSPVSEGNYVLWTASDHRLGITDLTTLTTTFIGKDVFSYTLNRQGVVVYVDKLDPNKGLEIFRYSIASQTTEQLTQANGIYGALGQVVDSNDIIYARYSADRTKDSIYFYDGQQTRAVSPYDNTSKYFLRDRYILFGIKDNMGAAQVWQRTPADTLRRLSFFSTDSRPDLLGNYGKALFLNNKSRYYTDNKTSFTRVSGEMGTTYSQGGRFYLTLGGALFQYDMGEDTLSPLPANSFIITNTGASCRGSANGAINVSAKVADDYVATLSGNGKDATYTFTRSLTVEGLAAGTYNICLTTQDPQRPPQCFTTVIKEPAALSVAMVTSEADGKTRLMLSGGDVYHVEVNGRLQTTQAGEITPELRNGMNTIVVSTDKPCQGTIVKHITREGDATVYPNPFSESLVISLGNKPVSRAVVTLYDANGKIVYSRVYTQQSGAITIEPGDIGNGMYMLKLNGDQREQTFKLLKK
ncbi:T9SS type A sorting domain-containing protein [Chitinophaga varians]|uniref:T9SS type A sorting domain-containing protein n=1 Tax=Chitinophaga varians TaxID=2202339 RepID=UPI00165FC276|nr:T9SS type A sorting domain-containing protein [Chitinophaga varians]MBC9914392.1 T9SS type A sorting domain-containing protein [Chitinophaga varians]